MSVLPRDVRPRRSALREQAVAPEARRRRDGVGVHLRRRASPSRSSTPGVACFDKGPFSRGTRPGRDALRGRLELRRRHATRPTTTRATAPTSPGTIAQTTNNGVGAAGLAFCARAHAHQGPQQAGLGHASPTSPRASASRPTTARRSSTCRLGGPIKSAHPRGRGRPRRSRRASSSSRRRATAAGRSAGRRRTTGVVAVSATDENDKIAWFSSRGPEVAIAAPGVGRDPADDLQRRQEQVRDLRHVQRHEHGLAARRRGGRDDRVAGRDRSATPSATRSSRARDARRTTPSLYGAGILDAGRRRRTSSGATSSLRLGARSRSGVARRAAHPQAGRQPSPGRAIRRCSGRCFASVGLLPVRAAHVGLCRTPVQLGMAVRARDAPVRRVGHRLGAGVHRWLLLASALPVLVAVGGRSSESKRCARSSAVSRSGPRALLTQMAWSARRRLRSGGWPDCALWAVGNVAGLPLDRPDRARREARPERLRLDCADARAGQRAASTDRRCP